MLALGFVVADPAWLGTKIIAAGGFLTILSGTENLAELGRMVLWKGAHDTRLEVV
jgi:hypothetical protein